MKIYKLMIESWGETLSEYLYVNKDNAINEGKKRVMKDNNIPEEDVEVRDMTYDYYIVNKRCPSIIDVKVEVVETVDESTVNE